MSPRQQIVTLILGVAILALILELIRRRRLREEYSWLWMLTGAIAFLLVVWYDLLVFITRLVGIVVPTSTVFFFGLIFLVLINVHYSVKISTLTTQVKELAQKLAILEGDLQQVAGPEGGRERDEAGRAGP